MKQDMLLLGHVAEKSFLALGMRVAVDVPLEVLEKLFEADQEAVLLLHLPQRERPCRSSCRLMTMLMLITTISTAKYILPRLVFQYSYVS